MLIAYEITSKDSEYYGARCEDCRRPHRIGDVAMVFDQGRGVYVDRELAWHRHCIEAALDSAPQESHARAAEGERVLAEAT